MRLDEANATSIAVMLNGIETWLRRAPDDVVASLAATYGEPATRALQWARELISELRYYRTVMALAVRAGDDPDDDRSAF